MKTLSSISVRMYYTGFGDCFLLTFRYEDKTVKTLWIDFGARAGNTIRMREIAEHLKDYLTKEGLIRNQHPFIDVLAITHEHQDHISGIKQARSELEGLDIGQVWFAWTEDPKDEMAQAWRKHKKQARESLEKAVKQVHQEVTHLTQLKIQQATQLATATTTSQFADLENLLGATDRTKQVAENMAQRLNLMAGFEFAAREIENNELNADTNELDFTVNQNYEWLIDKVGKENIRYLHPGYTDVLGKITQGHLVSEGFTQQPSPTIFPALKLFVLGPPRDLKIIRASEPENWQNSLKANTAPVGFNFDQSSFSDVPEDIEKDFWYYVQKAPFDEEFVLPIDLKSQKLPPQAASTIQENPTAVSRQVEENFGLLSQMKVFKNYFEPKQAYRQINTDYLVSADDLAIKLNTGVNNTSLVLAIEIDQTNEVLFFSGDAEFGVWDDWVKDQSKLIKDRQYVWTLPSTVEGTTRSVTVEDLMARTIFYKMGHHGSQNATPNTRGIGKLNNPHLHCLIPVDQNKAKLFHWDKIPFQELLDKLDGRQIPYIRADESQKNVADAKARSGLKPLPSGSKVTWNIASEITADSDLYVDWTLTLPK